MDNDECYKTMIIKQFVIALSVLIWMVNVSSLFQRTMCMM